MPKKISKIKRLRQTASFKRTKKIDGITHYYHGYRSSKDEATKRAKHLKGSYGSTHVRKGSGINHKRYEIWVS